MDGCGGIWGFRLSNKLRYFEDSFVFLYVFEYCEGLFGWICNFLVVYEGIFEECILEVEFLGDVLGVDCFRMVLCR